MPVITCPHAPPAPVRDPFSPAEPSPFSASPFGSPFGASPFGGGSGATPPRSPFASPFEEPERKPGPKKDFVRRTIVLIPPGRPVVRSGWAFPYDTAERIWGEFNQCSVEPDLLRIGYGLDFDLLARCQAEADHNNEYCPFEQGYDWVEHDGEPPPACSDFHGVDAQHTEPGQELWTVCDELLEQWREQAWLEGEQDRLDPDEIQVLVFERLRTPALEGKYVVTGATNHPWTDEDRPEAAPSYMGGWREVTLAPCDDEWNLTG